MALPKFENCPNCNGNLEVGYLSFLGYLKWCFDKPSKLHGFEGELVAGSNVLTINRSTTSLKCSKCNLILHFPDK